jgi:hypothetical protein
VSLRLALGAGVGVLLASAPARGDAIPIVTLTDVGPDQEVPTDRAFYIVGDAPPTLRLAQVVIVRKGSASIFGDDGPSCRRVVAGLAVDSASSIATDDDEEEDRAAPVDRPKLDAGLHAAFEVFPHAAPEVRDAEVLVTAAWQRADDDTRRYEVLVPHETRFFSAGFAYCLIVVATDRAQQLDDAVIVDSIGDVAKKIVACGDKSSCQDEVLDDFETRVMRALTASRTLSSGDAHLLAGKLKSAARDDLGSSTALIEARDHHDERWHRITDVMTPMTSASWLDASRDPFARAVAAALARTGGLLPHVVASKKGTTVALYTTDGKLAVKALQLLDDGKSIRVASSQAPTGDQAHVLTATTDGLTVADGITIFDLVELGRGKLRVDKEWTTLAALGDRAANVGLDGWTGDDTTYVTAAAVRLRRLSDFVDSVTTNVPCSSAIARNSADPDTERRALGEWLACQHADTDKLDSLAHLLDDLGRADEAWRATRDRLTARAKRVATVATTAPAPTRVSFTARTWLFSYVTPVVGYATVVRPDESFGLFYVGAQIHFDPNPAADIPWRDGVTTRDLRRAIALELAVAPYGSTFGPDSRYTGVGGVPPIFIGLAAHVVPYTALTIGGTIVDRRRSSIVEEQAHPVFAPYVGIAIQFNVPDLIRGASHPTTHTAASR